MGETAIMKYLVDYELLQKYLPDNELVEIVEKHKVNHREYMQNWRKRDCRLAMSRRVRK